MYREYPRAPVSASVSCYLWSQVLGWQPSRPNSVMAPCSYLCPRAKVAFGAINMASCRGLCPLGFSLPLFWLLASSSGPLILAWLSWPQTSLHVSFLASITCLSHALGLLALRLWISCGPRPREGFSFHLWALWGPRLGQGCLCPTPSFPRPGGSGAAQSPYGLWPIQGSMQGTSSAPLWPVCCSHSHNLVLWFQLKRNTNTSDHFQQKPQVYAFLQALPPFWALIS